MQRKTVTVVNKLGLHARAAAKFVAHASRFISDIQVIKNENTANGKSIMGLMMLAASKNSSLEIITNGDDEVAAVEDLTVLVEQRFGEAE